MCVLVRINSRLFKSILRPFYLPKFLISLRLIHSTQDALLHILNAAILKDSEFNEVDRAECQFSTTATILDNGSIKTPGSWNKHYPWIAKEKGKDASHIHSL